MHTVNTAAVRQAASTTNATSWSLRSPAEELRAAIVASRSRIGLAHARAVIDLQRSGRRY